jgi:hypothetical protein
VIFSCNWFISSSRCGTRLFFAFAIILPSCKSSQHDSNYHVRPSIQKHKSFAWVCWEWCIAKGTMKKYDQNIILPLLLWAYYHLNLVNAPIEHVANLDENDFFG